MHSKLTDDNNHIESEQKTYNINAHFIAANPSTPLNPVSVSPTIDKTVYIGPFSSVIGDVRIRNNVFIAANVSIRADEGTPFYIGANTNIQDGVIMHGLQNGRVLHEKNEYSIYIGENTSCAHGCIIHGPCKLGNNVFVGFHAIMLNAVIGEGCYISANVLVTGGIIVKPNRFIPAGAIIDTQEKADLLSEVPKGEQDFAKEVQLVNNAFPSSYDTLFGTVRCSCGLTCNKDTIHNILD